MPVPEDIVSIAGVPVFEPSVAVELPWVECHLKLLVALLQRIHKLQSILQMHIVVAGAVRDSEEIGRISLILLHKVHKARIGIALRIILRSIHIALCVVGIVEGIVINTAACNSIREILSISYNRSAGYRTSVREAGNAHLLSVNIRTFVELLHPGNVILKLYCHKVSVHKVHTLLAAMSGGPVVHLHSYHPLIGPPLGCLVNACPGIHYRTCIGAAVDKDYYRITLCGIQIYREGNLCRYCITIHIKGEHLRESYLIVVKLLPFGIINHIYGSSSLSYGKESRSGWGCGV